MLNGLYKFTYLLTYLLYLLSVRMANVPWIATSLKR